MAGRRALGCRSPPARGEPGDHRSAPPGLEDAISMGLAVRSTASAAASISTFVADPVLGTMTARRLPRTVPGYDRITVPAMTTPSGRLVTNDFA
jgi:hypothetical protein